jgi:pyoverdine/dityrosine biosynthesis protein Dit1
MKKVLLLTLCLACFGCEDKFKGKCESSVTDPVSVLKPPPKEWLDKYGDTDESRIIYSIAVIDVNNLQQHRKLAGFILADANRIDRLEKTVLENDPNK